MTITIHRKCPATAVRRTYRIECPEQARLHTQAALAQETILIPGPDSGKYPERTVWLRIEEAIQAAREGRYGLRLLAEEEFSAQSDFEMV